MATMAQRGDVLNGQLPLTGVVLCCTSLTQDVRTRLAEVAISMGATHKLDLTSDVTHLIVGSITTPKYRYVARERPDIKVLHPDWIETVRQSWMEGGSVDVRAMEMRHTLPPFPGLHICVTGFDDLEHRSWLSSTIEEQGATYHGDLTKAVTHLIAAAPQGAKYTAAKQWGLNIVSVEWLKGSLCRGMALDESLYDPALPVEKQGVGAFREEAKTRTSLGKRGREPEPQRAASGEVGKKKLRRTASTRLESQSQDMWQDMSAREVFNEAAEADQWNDEDSRAPTRFSGPITRPGTTESNRKRSGTSMLLLEANAESDGLFSGICVFLHGFEKSKATLLQKFLEPNGAHVVQSQAELENASRNAFFKDRYFVVPHAASDAALNLPEVPPSTIVATEWWVERCIHYKHLLDPTLDHLSRPLWDIEVPGFTDLLVSTTGFTGVDLRQLAEAVKLMGATYQEKVLSTSSVLISGSTTIKKEKAFYASRHGIPVVSIEWLWTCLKTKKKAPFEKFGVHLPAIDSKEFVDEPSTSSLMSSDMLRNRTSGETRKIDDQHPKRLSSIRKRHMTPSLALHATKASTPAAMQRPKPFMYEDDDDSPSLDSELIDAATACSKHSQPLQEVFPNLSPREASDRSNAEVQNAKVNPLNPAQTRSRTVSTSKPASPPESPRASTETSNIDQQQPSARPQADLTADLAELLNRQTTSRPGSAIAPETHKRKSRPLGRALSGISNRSASVSNRSEHASPALPSAMSESAVDGFGVSREQPLPPSTQLGYETPEAEAHRLQMSKKMGTKLQDDAGGLRRVASLGTVKDSLLSEDVVGSRLRGRQRAK